VSLGGRAVGWLEAEVQQWLERRIEASRSEGTDVGATLGARRIIWTENYQRSSTFVALIWFLDDSIRFGHIVLFRPARIGKSQWKSGVGAALGHHGFLKWKPLLFANRDNRLVTPIQELDSPILLRTIWFDREKWKLGVNRFPPPVKSFPVGDLRMALDRERPMHRGPLAGQSFQSKDEMLQKLKADSSKDVKIKSSRNE
jgi:hypothetical protein